MLLTVVAAASRDTDVAIFLDALGADGLLDAADVEVIIVQEHPSHDWRGGPVTGLTLGRNASIFELWGAGIRAARSAAIAILDVRCPPKKGWHDAVRAQFPLQVPVLFGPVACGIDDQSADVVGYLTEYVQFAPPLDPALAEIPGLNLVVSRTLACDEVVLRADGFVKTRLLAKLVREKLAAPRPIESAIVDYRKTYKFLEYCLHRYRHARCYAADRAMPSAIWSRARALLASPLLPALRTWRIYRYARRRPAYARATLHYLHRIIAAETAWAWGEFVGYLAGAGQARRLLR